MTNSQQGFSFGHLAALVLVVLLALVGTVAVVGVTDEEEPTIVEVFEAKGLLPFGALDTQHVYVVDETPQNPEQTLDAVYTLLLEGRDLPKGRYVRIDCQTYTTSGRRPSRAELVTVRCQNTPETSADIVKYVKSLSGPGLSG